ncbi:hypothetical protein IC575_004538 [Cucumis melo]
MDMAWMIKDRLSMEYEEGVDRFIEFAQKHSSGRTSMSCPCIRCGNCKTLNTNKVRNHLLINGINQRYDNWIWHGENLTKYCPTNLVLDTDYNSKKQFLDDNVDDNMVEMVEEAQQNSVHDPQKFKKLLTDAEKPLYPGCENLTKLGTLVKLYHLKEKFEWSDTSFTELLSLLKIILPENNELPASTYDAKKVLFTLGMTYEKIHACPNDCCLYRKEFADISNYPHCNESRWKKRKNSSGVQKGVPAKVVWYFPPIPRFQRMFNNQIHSKNLTWHANERLVDGNLRHPADSPSWKLVDHLWSDFGSEERNFRLALSTDGINPHSEMNSKYSCWPVILTTYNLPPWLCMRRKFMMLTMLISGPKQSGYNIDVYLAPLIDDLKILWNDGVLCYDGYRNEVFTLKTVLLWTINDFPAYGNLAGCTIKGYCACPICDKNTSAIHLKFEKKMVYLGHRKFLPLNRPFKKQKKVFNNEKELGIASQPLSEESIFEMFINNDFSNDENSSSTRKRSLGFSDSCWKKKSIFFELEYWKKLHVRHCLDVMHIEKNVCMNLLGTLLDIPGKSKDGLQSRRDLEQLGIRSELVLKVVGNRTYTPPACYTLSKSEKRTICQSLSKMKVLEGYSSNIKILVSIDTLKLTGLKSHDCHVLMQQLLSVAIRGVLPKHVRNAITRFYLFFNAICSKVVDVTQLSVLEQEIAVILCLFEKYFPPSFFTIMIHLTIHLVREVRLCGPVYLRWMYPFERYMKVLKGYVRNRNRLEGSIAEGYIVEEAIEFCTESCRDNMSIGLGKAKERDQNDDIGRPSSAASHIRPEKEQLMQAHLYVLENINDVQPYIKYVDFKYLLYLFIYYVVPVRIYLTIVS